MAALTLIPLGPASAAGDTPTGPTPVVTVAPPGSTPASSAPKAPPVAKPPAKAPKSAAAAGDEADVSVAITGTKIALGSQSKPFVVTVTNNSSTVTTRSATVDVQATTVDQPQQLSGLQAISATCKKDPKDAGHFTCAIGDIGPGQKRALQFQYSLDKTAVVHDNTASITAKVQTASPPDPNLSNNTATAQVDIVPAGIDLGVSIPDTSVAFPGGTATTYAQIRNDGAADATGVSFSVRSPDGTGIHGVALMDTSGGYGVKCTTTSHTGATCSIGGLQAHHYVTARIILDVTEFAASSSTITGGVGSVTGIAPSSMQALAKNNAKANDKILQRKATAKATSAVDDPSDNSDSFAVPITDLPKADLGVTATAVSGAKVGDTVTINANVANHGPNLAAGIYVMITVPSNTGFAAISQVCQHTSNARTIKCVYSDTLGADKSVDFPIKVKVHGTPGSDGSLTVHGSAVDLSSANNSASLSIALDTATATTAANASNTGTLPVTGDKVGLYAFGGALLLLMGGALTITARRRRSA
ncbi:hypothetical protein GCM10009765_00900 [Fodinicola feengrottensis]|uniref:Gram-positive cocci surface proteins LPxTG domain-containing protein n=1 Tax=Fodinicola feengrottensis TaxID=435914 RepID=A0ABN2FP55_9ACTN